MELASLITLNEGKWIGDKSYKTRADVLGDDKEISIDNANALDDVTIRWRGANHWGNKTFEHLGFEAEDVIDDHGNEGKDMVFMAQSEDEKWIFAVDVYVEANYEMSGNIGDWNWDTLEIDEVKEIEKAAPELDEGTCGYTHQVSPKTGRRGKELKTPGGTKGMSALNRTNFMASTRSSNTY